MWRHHMKTLSQSLPLFLDEAAGHRWIPLTKAKMWEHKQAAKRIVELPVIWDAIVIIWHHFDDVQIRTTLVSK